MDIETRVLSCEYKEYLNFGWKYEKEQTSSHISYTPRRRGRVIKNYVSYVLTRDKDLENYRLLVALENKYFALKEKRKYYNPIDGMWCFILFACFIIPGILYVVFKSHQKNKIEDYNYALKKQMNEVVNQAKALF